MDCPRRAPTCVLHAVYALLCTTAVAAQETIFSYDFDGNLRDLGPNGYHGTAGGWMEYREGYPQCGRAVWVRRTQSSTFRTRAPALPRGDEPWTLSLYFSVENQPVAVHREGMLHFGDCDNDTNFPNRGLSFGYNKIRGTTYSFFMDPHMDDDDERRHIADCTFDVWYHAVIHYHGGGNMRAYIDPPDLANVTARPPAAILDVAGDALDLQPTTIVIGHSGCAAAPRTGVFTIDRPVLLRPIVEDLTAFTCPPPPTQEPLTSPPPTAVPDTLAPPTPTPTTLAPPTPLPQTPIPATLSPPTVAPPTPAPPTLSPSTPSPPSPSPPTPLPPTLAPPTTIPSSPSPPSPSPPTPAPPTLRPPSPARPTPPPSTPHPSTPHPPTRSPATPHPPSPTPPTMSPPTRSPPGPAPVTPSPSTLAPPTAIPATLSPRTPLPQTRQPTPVPLMLTQSPPTSTPPTGTPPTGIPATGVPPTGVPPTPSPPTGAPATLAPGAPLTQVPPTSMPPTPSPPTLAPPTRRPPVATFAPLPTPTPQTQIPTAPPPTPLPLTPAPTPPSLQPTPLPATPLPTAVVLTDAPRARVLPVAATQAPTPPSVVPPEQKERLRDIGKAASVAAVIAGPAAGSAGKLAIVRSFGCDMDDVDLGFGEPLEFEFSPTGAAIGDGPPRYLVGAVVMNITIVVACAVVSVVVAGAVRRCCGSSWEEALGRTKTPGVLLIPFAFLLPGTSLVSCRLLFFPRVSGAGGVVLGLGGLLYCVCVPLAMYRYVLRRIPRHAREAVDEQVADEDSGEDERLYEPDMSDGGVPDAHGSLASPQGAVVSADAGSAQGASPGHDASSPRSVASQTPSPTSNAGSFAKRVKHSHTPASTLRGRIGRRVYLFVFGNRIWVSSLGDPQFCDKYGLMFDNYERGTCYMLLMEFAVTLLLSLFSVWKPGSDGECTFRNIVITLLLVGWFVALLITWPFLSPLENYLAVVLAGGTAIAVLMMSIGIGAGGEGASIAFKTAGWCLVLSAWLVLVKAILDITLYIYDLWMERRKGAREAERRRLGVGNDQVSMVSLEEVPLDALSDAMSDDNEHAYSRLPDPAADPTTILTASMTSPVGLASSMRTSSRGRGSVRDASVLSTLLLSPQVSPADASAALLSSVRHGSIAADTSMTSMRGMETMSQLHLTSSRNWGAEGGWHASGLGPVASSGSRQRAQSPTKMSSSFRVGKAPARGGGTMSPTVTPRHAPASPLAAAGPKLPQANSSTLLDAMAGGGGGASSPRLRSVASSPRLKTVNSMRTMSPRGRGGLGTMRVLQ